MNRILIVEDDEDINKLLKKHLENAGYQVSCAYSGTEARLLLSMESCDLILLDLMIPGISGEELIQLIRKKDNTPILVISAKSTLEDKVKVLKNGADDYMTKPFEREEVIARVEAILRRSKGALSASESGVLEFKNLSLNETSREVFVKDKPINLTGSEFDILLFLLKHPEKVFTKEQLYQEIWQNNYYGEDNTINVHISNIRKKIKDYDEEESYIKTVWGIGFKMDTSADRVNE